MTSGALMALLLILLSIEFDDYLIWALSKIFRQWWFYLLVLFDNFAERDFLNCFDVSVVKIKSVRFIAVRRVFHFRKRLLSTFTAPMVDNVVLDSFSHLMNF